MHWAGVCVSQHALGRRVSAQGVSAFGRGGGVCPGVSFQGVSTWEVSAQGEGWGCLSRAYLFKIREIF